eukprot:Em0019g1089a
MVFLIASCPAEQLTELVHLERKILVRISTMKVSCESVLKELIQNWYHPDCFFESNTVGTVDNIEGFEALRWDDQQKIKKWLQSSEGIDDVKKSAPIRHNFEVEHAKSGRSTCRACLSQIDKGSIRIAKIEVADPQEKKGYAGPIPEWHHVACFLENRDALNATDVKAEELSGFNKVRRKLQGRELQGRELQGRELQGRELQGRELQGRELQGRELQGRELQGRELQGRELQGRELQGRELQGRELQGRELQGRELQGRELQGRELQGRELQGRELQGRELQGRELQGRELQGRELQGRELQGRELQGRELQGRELQGRELQGRELQERDDLKVMLEKNNQMVPVGESKVLDYCADGMVFGALKPCPKCKGQLEASSPCYECTGNISAWTSCTYKTLAPERDEWVISDDLKSIPFLKSYKFKPRKREFTSKSESADQTSKSQSQSQSQSQSEPSHSQSEGSTPEYNEKTPPVSGPLKGFTVIVIGRLKKTKAEVTKEIKDLGGNVVTSTSDTTTICISNKKEVEKMSKMMKEVKSHDIPVVGEDYLADVAKGGALLKIPTHTISSWDSPRESVPSASDGSDSEKPMPKGLTESHHVYEDGGVVYNAVLELVDIAKGTNSYYKLQLLEGNGKNYCLFRAWGRVGTSVGNSKVEHFGASKEAAKQEFESLYFEKTGNSWNKSGDVVKQPGKYYPIEIDYSQVPEDTAESTAKPAGANSKLTVQVQNLVKMIFDIEAMKATMEEFKIDVSQMPLGNVSRHEIQSAYSVLSELQQEITGGKNPSKLLDASNRFYTLVPHDFGLQKPTVLDTDELISAQTKMLDDLLEIEVAYNLLKEGSSEGEKDVLDVHYEQLKSDIEVLDKNSSEFKLLEQYLANTQAPTHQQYKLEIIDAFKVTRQGEEESYRPFQTFHNRYLLWHGSRATNFAGILSQGLRIAPPEAPSTGYMFGKGVYFADMVSKSMSSGSCAASRLNPVGLLLLCEVALGNMYEKTESEFITKLPPGKHSTKGIGRICPDPKDNKVLDDGLIVPIGKGVSAPVTHTSFPYNEYPYEHGSSSWIGRGEKRGERMVMVVMVVVMVVVVGVGTNTVLSANLNTKLHT